MEAQWHFDCGSSVKWIMNFTLLRKICFLNYLAGKFGLKALKSHKLIVLHYVAIKAFGERYSDTARLCEEFLTLNAFSSHFYQKWSSKKKKRKLSFKAACKNQPNVEEEIRSPLLRQIFWTTEKTTGQIKVKVLTKAAFKCSAVSWVTEVRCFMCFIRATDNIQLFCFFYNLVLNRILIIFIKRVKPLQRGGKKSAQQIAEIGQDGAMKYSGGTECQTQSSLSRKEGSWPQEGAAVWRQPFSFTIRDRNCC